MEPNDDNRTHFSPTKLRILYWNSRSVCDKLEEISKIILDVDVLICVESWLKEGMNFQFPGFNTLRKDRPHSAGGGIVFLIRKTYFYTEIKNLNHAKSSTELCGIEMPNLKEPVAVIACYKPPDISLNDQEWYSILSNSKINSRCLFMGDFNSHNQSWNCSKTDDDGKRLLEQSEKFDLFLHNNNSVTRVNKNNHCRSNIDLVFSTTNIAHLLKVKVTDDSLASDHFPIYIEYDAEKYRYYKKTFKIQSQRTNWSRVSMILEREYRKFLLSDYDSLTPIEKYDLFIETVKDAVIKSTPKRKIVGKFKHRNPVAWWDNDCDRIKRFRQAAYKKWTYTGNIEDHIEYKK